MNSEKRNMDKLAMFVPDDIYFSVANKILGLEKGNVFITTGFHCFGTHETDGPLGAIFCTNFRKTWV